MPQKARRPKDKQSNAVLTRSSPSQRFGPFLSLSSPSECIDDKVDKRVCTHSMSLNGVVVVLVVHGLALDDDVLLLVIILHARLLGVSHLLSGRTRSLLLGDGVGVENTTTFGRRVLVVGSRALSLSLFSLARCGSLGRAGAADLGRSGGVAASIFGVARVALLERLLNLLAPLLGYGLWC